VHAYARECRILPHMWEYVASARIRSMSTLWPHMHEDAAHEQIGCMCPCTNMPHMRKYATYARVQRVCENRSVRAFAAYARKKYGAYAHICYICTYMPRQLMCKHMRLNAAYGEYAAYVNICCKDANMPHMPEYVAYARIRRICTYVPHMRVCAAYARRCCICTNMWHLPGFCRIRTYMPHMHIYVPQTGVEAAYGIMLVCTLHPRFPRKGQAPNPDNYRVRAYKGQATSIFSITGRLHSHATSRKHSRNTHFGRIPSVAG